MRKNLRELALFAGAGGGILGGKLLGWRTICAVENNAYAASILIQRQNDGILGPFPVWDDVRTFDGRPWKGIVDVVSGGFPCQDISVAGKGAGITGERSGLWKEMARIIGEVGPKFVWVENSPMLTLRGLGTVLGDLSEMGYDARWGIVGAHHASAPHRRDRIWIYGYSNRKSKPAGTQHGETPQLQEMDDSDTNSAPRSPESKCQYSWAEKSFGCCQGEMGSPVANPNRTGCQEQWGTVSARTQHQTPECNSWWTIEPALGRVAHGVANRVDRLKAIGNGQVPAVVKLAWGELINEQT